MHFSSLSMAAKELIGHPGTLQHTSVSQSMKTNGQTHRPFPAMDLILARIHDIAHWLISSEQLCPFLIFAEINGTDFVSKTLSPERLSDTSEPENAVMSNAVYNSSLKIYLLIKSEVFSFHVHSFEGLVRA